MVTEIEIYDTEQPADPTTGERPLKARIRQTRGAETIERTQAECRAKEQAKQETQAEQLYGCETLAEVTVTAEKPPGTLERMKQVTAWALAIMILAAAGYVIYKFRKR